MLISRYELLLLLRRGDACTAYTYDYSRVKLTIHIDIHFFPALPWQGMARPAAAL